MTQHANIKEHDTHRGTSKRAPSRYVTSANTHLQHSFFAMHLFLFEFSSDTIIVFHTYYAITGGREEAAVF